jgi:hypothetical protein
MRLWQRKANRPPPIPTGKRPGPERECSAKAAPALGLPLEAVINYHVLAR